MKKLLYQLFILLLVSTPTFAQTADADTSWKMGGFIGITFNQVSLSNWVQGGENSMSLSGNAKLFANYAKDKTEWANDLIMNYAMVRTKTDGLTKSDDRIDLNSKYGHKLSDKWLLSLLFNFKSQFAPGYEYPNDTVLISDIFSPAYFTLGVGVTWKPVEYFEVFLSPATAKLTIVNNQPLADAGAYGVKPGENSRLEFGAYLNLKFKKEIVKNVTLTSKLELFDNYTDENPDNRSRIDVNWDSYLDMKINDFLTASLNVLVLYDADIIEKTQVKEMFGIGIGIKFPKEEKK